MRVLGERFGDGHNRVLPRHGSNVLKTKVKRRRLHGFTAFDSFKQKQIWEFLWLCVVTARYVKYLK